MISLKDILELLDRWDDWKKMKACPSRIDTLEKQVAELLKQPKGKQCPGCFNSTFALTKDEPDPMFGDLGARLHTYTCSSCGLSTQESKDPSNR